MAAAQSVKILDNNPSIKNIFNTMDYGKSSESTNLSTAWIKSRENIASTVNGGNRISQGEPIIIKDANNKQTLITVYSPKPEDLDVIISEITENHEWNTFAGLERSLLLDKFANEIERNSTLFSQLEISIRGILSTDTKLKALPLLVGYLRYYASWSITKWISAHKVACSVLSDSSFLAVFGLVLGPALASGYKVILQTEPKISVVASLIVELAENVGIPHGVIRLVPGKVNLSSIINSIDVLSCFGSLHGEKYQNFGYPTKTKILAMTNGKIPMVVFNSSDLDSAADSVVQAAWGYGGALPWSVGTVLVQEDIFNIFVDKLMYRLSKVKMGHATEQLVDISYPLMENALEQLQISINEAKLQGIEVSQMQDSRNTFQPTLFIGGRVFGNNVITEDNNLPVVTVLPFRTCNEAINLANNSRYGFGASVWTENIGLANEITKKLDVGTVWINSHGDFAVHTAMTPHKQSGIGYFGGSEGFLEYFEMTTNRNEETKSFQKPSNLPTKLQGSPVQSFYGGSFKKSESGLISGIYDCPAGKDLNNAIGAAKKAQVAWNKMTIGARNLLLRKVANALVSNKKHLRENFDINEEIIDNWILFTYDCLTNINNLSNITTENSYDLRSYREPVGVIVIEESCLNLAAIGSMLLGNSVIIILNQQSNSTRFYLEICKYFSLSNMPPGVFNVILNCNEDIYKAILLNKELDACITFNLNTFKPKNVEILNRYYCMQAEDWPEIIRYVTKIKNVWSNIGQSVL